MRTSHSAVQLRKIRYGTGTSDSLLGSVRFSNFVLISTRRPIRFPLKPACRELLSSSQDTLKDPHNNSAANLRAFLAKPSLFESIQPMTDGIVQDSRSD
ncbi:hypothetical protein LshimejAT787_1801360 [Lyophyllum shimeji]|uniref:Uncharacterized protein n=1 Tax=Lyophyllum shimeji TaxID=47721 RepID=A0A9P3UR84_LYOSH|nr:hypothetical protein LshimejAT787_1801360 [Lyophyllum shimeji]